MSATGSVPDLKTRVMTVLWPAFLMAGVLEMMVFAVVDPHQLHGWGIDTAQWPAGAVYTVSFFLFWSVISVAAAMAVWLCQCPPAPNPAGD